LNRNERRRQAKCAGRGRFVITGAFLGHHDLIKLLDQSPTIAPTLASMLAAMESDRPPLCGGCGADLTDVLPPAAYLLLLSGSGEQLLSGICFECISGDPAALRRRLANVLGVEPLPEANLHLERWGRA
jgi:hypothetical protein